MEAIPSIKSTNLRIFKHRDVAERPPTWLHDHSLPDVETPEIALRERMLLLHPCLALSLDFEIAEPSVVRVPGVLLEERPDRLAGVLDIFVVASA